jgi:hypothetical protein
MSGGANLIGGAVGTTPGCSGVSMGTGLDRHMSEYEK